LGQNLGQDFGQNPNLIASQNLVQNSGQILNQILGQNLGLNSGQILNLILGENHVQISDIGTGRRGGRSSPPPGQKFVSVCAGKKRKKVSYRQKFLSKRGQKISTGGRSFRAGGALSFRGVGGPPSRKISTDNQKIWAGRALSGGGGGRQSPPGQNFSDDRPRAGGGGGGGGRRQSPWSENSSG
jgi:hypothetical protein